jgi:transcriptional regulator with XRE-family HTH domain
LRRAEIGIHHLIAVRICAATRGKVHGGKITAASRIACNLSEKNATTADWCLLLFVTVRFSAGRLEYFFTLILIHFWELKKMIAAKAINPTDKHVGERVRMYRIKAAMSQYALGKQIGITFQQIQKYEKGTNRIGASRLQQISEILNIPVASLFEDLPGPKHNGSADNLINEFVEFLGTSLGQRLVQGFTKIPDRNVRSNLTRLIESISEKSPPVPKPTSKKKR